MYSSSTSVWVWSWLSLCGEHLDARLVLVGGADVDAAELEHGRELLLGVVALELDVLEDHEGLHELRDSVDAVGLDLVDRVQQAKDRFEDAHALGVGRVLDDRHHSERVRVLLDGGIRDGEHGVSRVQRVNQLARDLVLHVCVREERLVEHVVRVHDERAARVEARHAERLVPVHAALAGIRHDEAVPHAADAHPLHDLHVAGVLVGGDAAVVEALHLVGQQVARLLGVLAAVRGAVGAVGDRLAGKGVGAVLRDLVRAVLHHDVADVRPDLLHALEHGLVAEEVPAQVVYVASVLGMDEPRPVEELAHVVRRDVAGRAHDPAAPAENGGFFRKAVLLICHQSAPNASIFRGAGGTERSNPPRRPDAMGIAPLNADVASCGNAARARLEGPADGLRLGPLRAAQHVREHRHRVRRVVVAVLAVQDIRRHLPHRDRVVGTRLVQRRVAENAVLEDPLRAGQDPRLLVGTRVLLLHRAEDAALLEHVGHVVGHLAARSVALEAGLLHAVALYAHGELLVHGLRRRVVAQEVDDEPLVRAAPLGGDRHRAVVLARALRVDDGQDALRLARRQGHVALEGIGAV